MRIIFESRFFEKKKFSQRILSRYFNNALKDLQVAIKDKRPEVIFTFSYNALIKIGITLIALCGYRVKSRRGHHIKILEKLSQILGDKDIEIVGERMRKKRNLDLYEGGIIISQKEAKDYLDFVKGTIKKAEKYLKSQPSLF